MSLFRFALVGSVHGSVGDRPTDEGQVKASCVTGDRGARGRRSLEVLAEDGEHGIAPCIALHCIALHCIALHCIALHCIALHCIALRCIALHCIATLHCSTLCSLVAWIGWPGGIFALPTKPASAACGGDATVVYQTIVPRATCPEAACSPPRVVQTTPSVASGARRPHADYETVMHTSRQLKHTHPASRS